MTLLPTILTGITLGLSGPGLTTDPPAIEIGLGLRPGPAIAVTIAVPGEQDGETTVSVAEEWGGIAGAGKEIGSLGASGRVGQALAISRTADHLWTIRHAPGERITLAYELTVQEREPLPPGHNDYRNVVREGLFHAIGSHALVLPEGLEGPVECSISWSGFDGWMVASSFGPGAATRRVTVPLDDLRSCFLIAGKPGTVRLSVRELEGNEVGLAAIDADWGFTDDRLLDLIMQVVAAERDFFGDHTDPWFLVALTPNGGRAGEHGFSFGGTGLLDCFALYCNTGLDISPGGPHSGRMLSLLAHEYFHTWNGRKIRIDGPERSAYWFSEGFTNYYARKLLLRAGLITAEEHLRSLNEAIAAYDRNPARNAPNARIVEEFWSDPDVGGLPYQRGDLLALAIDEAIGAASGGARSLDDVMRALYARAVSDEPPLTPEELFVILAAEAGHDFADSVRRCVSDGADPPLPETIGGGSLRLAGGHVRMSDDGFDVEASRKLGVVTGVREGSGAHEAGLRDGQRLVSIERLPSTAGPTGMRAETIDDDGLRRVRTFEAVGAPVQARRYEPVSE